MSFSTKAAIAATVAAPGLLGVIFGMARYCGMFGEITGLFSGGVIHGEDSHSSSSSTAQATSEGPEPENTKPNEETSGHV